MGHPRGRFRGCGVMSDGVYEDQTSALLIRYLAARKYVTIGVPAWDFIPEDRWVDVKVAQGWYVHWI